MGVVQSAFCSRFDDCSWVLNPRGNLMRSRILSILLTWLAAIAIVFGPAKADQPATSKPNILWLTCEDLGPHLGCYGDRYATSPNLDRLARRGMIYLNAWSNAPVCAPARTALITGVYPPSLGAQHMRSMVPLPRFMRMYPQFLRDAGYYCTNNRKEDYNVAKPGRVWDESSGRAHWRKRAPNQPFFAVFNMTITHESKIRQRPHSLVHDPSQVRVPAYHPDTPEVRHDWAQYYDNITTMDQQVGRRLKEIEEAGLADDTIVFFYSDHGSGMPRNKRWPYNCGLNVPLIVYIPPKYRHLAPAEYQPGGRSDRLVSFVDFGPTLLSLAGIRPPDYMQGRAFMGKFEASPREYVFGFRGRMDERYDMVRSVRDQRFVYVRNYMPHKIYGQHLWYMWETPTTRVWEKLFLAGKLKPEQAQFWQPKPPEELYDLRHDRDEVRNLAGAPEFQSVLDRMRRVLDQHLERTRDLGFLPEDEIHSRSRGTTPYEMGHDDSRYPYGVIAETARLAASLQPDAVARLRQRLGHDDSAVRYWAAMGLRMRGREVVRQHLAELRKRLGDAAPAVRIVAAEALAKFGDTGDRDRALATLLDCVAPKEQGLFVTVQALNALDNVDDCVTVDVEELRRRVNGYEAPSRRVRSYIPRLIQKIALDQK